MFLEHGTTKLLGYPPSPDPAPGMGTLLWAQGVVEFVGGLLLTIGAFTRLVAFLLAGVMAVVYFVDHAPKSFFPLLNGGEADILKALFQSAQVPALGGCLRSRQTVRVG